ncbi:uncharacterized protein RCO7_11618 [Rhynchosporium graminicola]|uniref:Uncharacterized protein n=1 Tax=Rhynchosporium graminicola TaxID=2792576 RepID=A0A1E1LJL5_9HELO|nr:uncharacterized protein RCO7_11618 [Rhynchosporium commune]
MASDPPSIQVSHLPSAASFYASLTQPLGLQYLSANPVSPACLHFGYILNSRAITVFTVSQAAHPRLSHITLSAPNPTSVKSFHSKSQVLIIDRSGRENTFKQEDEEDRAVTRDFDGNIIEAVYSPHSSVPRTTPSAMAPAGDGYDKEDTRVLRWQEDVARSISGSRAPSQPGPGTFRRADTAPAGFGRTREREMPTLVRRETITTEHYNISQAERDRLAGSNSGGGMSGKAIMGTLLGAAAGAAFAYAMTRSASPPPASATIRRSSAPQYTHEPIHMEDRERVMETRTIPARSHVSERERDRDSRPRYVQYTIAEPPPLTARPELKRIEEGSHVSTRSRRSSGKEKEGGSDTGKRTVLTIRPASSHKTRSPDRGSHVSHRSRKSGSGSAPATGSSLERRRGRDKEGNEDRASEYHSTRSHHSASTVKPPAVPQPPPASRAGSSRSKSTMRHVPDARDDQERKSHVSSRDRERRTSTVSAREPRSIPLPPSTVMSARQVPLPRSVVSGFDGLEGLGSGNGYGYAASVAPSDSVSSVGIKRERERLRDRMGDGGGGGGGGGVAVRERARGVLWGHG